MSATAYDAVMADIAAEKERRRTARAREQNRRLYARDPLLWIDDNVYFASKFDAEGGLVRIQAVKARLYPDQRDLIAAWIDLERLKATGDIAFANVLVEKSRQIGATWGVAAAVRWLMEYTSTRGMFMHTRKAEVQDRAWSVDSFFGRVQYIDRRLDASARAGGTLEYRPFSGDPASIESDSTSAYLRGECQRDDPGRGSTFDYAIVDEAAHVTHGEEVHKAIDDACPYGKLYMSTPEGEDNMHARLCETVPEGYEYVRIHWSGHPVYREGAHIAGEEEDCPQCIETRAGTKWSAREPKAHRYPGKLTSPWYERAIISKTNEQVASELDIDRAGALGARVYAEFDKGRHVIEAGIPYDPALPLELAWDFGLDATSIPIIQTHPSEVRIIGLYEAGDLFGSKATPDAVADGLRWYLTALGVPPELTADPASLAIRCVGDIAGGARSQQTGISDYEAYRNRGFAIAAPPAVLVSKVDTTITSVKMLLGGMPKLLQICGVNARAFATHMGNNVWPMDAQGNRTVGSTRPHDNVHNHACRAFAYWAVATHPPQGEGNPGIGRAKGQAAPPRFHRLQSPRSTRLRPELRG